MLREHRPESGVRFVEANGSRFGCLEWGSGPPLVLVHGFPDTPHTWDLIGPALAAAGYHVVAPFLRGYAPSAIPTRDSDSRTLGEDVLALVDTLGGKARLVGHDWGAEAVTAAASLSPDKIERLVTVAIPHRAAIKVSPSLAWKARHFITLTLPGAVARCARDDYAMIELLCRRWSPTWNLTAADLEPVKNAFAAPGSLDAALGYYRAASFRTPKFMLQKLPMPTLTIAGGDDPALSPADFEAARFMYSGSYQVATIPGGHFCHREAPQAFLDAVIPFLK